MYCIPELYYPDCTGAPAECGQWELCPSYFEAIHAALVHRTNPDSTKVVAWDYNIGGTGTSSGLDCGRWPPT
jgi:hypothetical protein